MVDNSDNSDNTDSSDKSSADAGFGCAAANNGGTASIDNSISLGSVAANTSVLSASVSGNTVVISAGFHATQSTSNSISDSFENSAGISVVGQNLGHNSLIQQNVNVQANLELN
jgi:hypothetical protein